MFEHAGDLFLSREAHGIAPNKNSNSKASVEYSYSFKN